MVKRRCVFFDRDGVINEKPVEGEYILRWEEFRLLPAAVDWIKLCNALELLVIVVTNQRCVAKGLLTLAQLDDLHSRMRAALDAQGARIDDIFVCPHAEGTCQCRKPRPGMVENAARKWNIDLAASALIGDSGRDQGLAQACGLRFLRAGEGRLL